MKIYIIGLIDHEEMNESCQPFILAERQLKAAGHTPTHLMYEHDWMSDKDFETKLRMDKLIACEAVFVLPGWEHDKIAQHEFALAITMDKKILFSNDVSHLPRRIEFNIPLNIKTF